jgi:hypothetical protein
MKHINKASLLLSLIITALTPTLFAAGGGGHSVGGSIIMMTPAQNDIDALIDLANQSAGGISTKAMGTAYEFMGHYTYRFSGTMFALQFRPSYFMHSSKGSGSGGDYNYELSGFTFFPMFRMTPLENSFIKFFMQLGLGYGRLSGAITEGAASIDFAGGNFGAMTGIGAEFCFTDEHCMVIEGNFRYLPIERNIASSVNGSFTSLSRAIKNKEVEYLDTDLRTTMSGVQGVLGYTYNF